MTPAFQGNINFNAQHSPMGAFMSFTCGHFHSGGGIAAELGRPAAHNLFVGVKAGPRRAAVPLRCLPFTRPPRPAAASSASYEVENPTPPAPTRELVFYDSFAITRGYGWASDTWTTPDFTFTIHTPFSSIPDPAAASDDPGALRDALLPAVLATLTVDNRGGSETKTAVFAIDFENPGTRLLSDPAAAGARQGFAWRRHLGVLGTLACPTSDPRALPALSAFQRWSVPEALSDVNPVHALGHCAGLAFEVAPGESQTLTIAIGVYLDGVVTTGLEGRYFYTRLYSSLDDVLNAALDRATFLRAQAAELDARLLGSGLSPDQQFLLAHATRSYYGSTQLLDVAGQPLWVVNEGEYCMMNTLDLAVDQMFWELDHNPWVVRNLLDTFARRYCFLDQLQTPSGKVLDGGLSFCHDMGVNNNFAAPGESSYELPHLTGCFSHMTAEQLCNYLLIAATYVTRAAGGAAWAQKNRHLVEACGQSLLNRCGGAGVIQYDSARCQGGAEITTYDSLDHSLAQTRNNLYIAVKCWAAFLAVQRLLGACGEAESNYDNYNSWLVHARAAAETVVRHAGKDGVIPAVFEEGNPGHAARILPAIEGLIYPLVWQTMGVLEPHGTFAGLLDALKQHTRACLLDPRQRNLFADGGLRLSSTSNNSWASKIAVFQHVARQVFGLHESDPAIAEIFARADAAHVKWQTDGSAYWACSDQFVNGVAKGSRYYPRIITAARWLSEQRRPRPTPLPGGRRESTTTTPS